MTAIETGAKSRDDKELAAATPGRDIPGAGASPVPEARGSLTAWLLDTLSGPPRPVAGAPPPDDDPITGDDAALALYLLYELHYRGVAGIHEGWEWEPSLLAVRQDLEGAFERRVRDEVGPLSAPDDIVEHLQRAVLDAEGRSVASWCAEQGALWHLREQAVQRSAWQLKEADPHSWAIPRLHGAPKAALVEIQADEYGQGVEKDIHAELYALTLRRMGLDDAYGAWLDHLPGITLSGVSLVSWFGLHRRWRGALVGHLAIFEMSSVSVMARLSAAMERLGFDTWSRLFYDTHVVADASHQTIAATKLAGGLVDQEPDLAVDVAFGAASVQALEAMLADHVLDAWEADRSSLRMPLPADGEAPGQRVQPVPARDPRDDGVT